MDQIYCQVQKVLLCGEWICWPGKAQPPFERQTFLHEDIESLFLGLSAFLADVVR
jgi:hypothetical protein